MNKKVIIISIIGLIVLIGGGVALATVMGKKKKPPVKKNGAGTGTSTTTSEPPTEPFFATNEDEAAQMKVFAKREKYVCTDGGARSAVLQGLYVPADANTFGQNQCGILHWMNGINSGALGWGSNILKDSGMKKLAEDAAWQRSQQVEKGGGKINFTW